MAVPMRTHLRAALAGIQHQQCRTGAFRVFLIVILARRHAAALGKTGGIKI
jgi:hypothetical protein